MMERRLFLQTLAQTSVLGFVGISTSACDQSNSSSSMNSLKISLAQWSLHRAFFDGTLDSHDFATITRNTYGLEAVEYVNQFYVDHSEDEVFWQAMKKRADAAQIQSLLIMVDDEGDLGAEKKEERIKAVEQHYKWIHAAKLLGCHSIRVNAFGSDDRKTYRAAIVDGMGRLASYAKGEDMQVIIENHGLFSSDGALLADIIKEVDLDNFGSFPDFGNWCLSAQWGSTQIPCESAYDRYQGVADLLPHARAVSAKSYDFDEQGNDTRIDYVRMLKLVKQSGYEGFIGIEYEGEKLSEHEGILATKLLLERAWEDA